jgi:integrase
MAKHGEITKRNVDALQPDARKDIFLWDGKLSGFGVRCRSTGAKYYFIKIRAGKRQRWLTIGKHGAPWTPDTARAEAHRLLGDSEHGVDPGVQRDSLKENPTVHELGEMFLEKHAEAKRKPRTAEYKRLLNVVVKPKIGSVRVCELARADVANLHHALRKVPYQANKVVAVLSKLFSWAQKQGIPLKASEGNPAKGIDRYKEHKRKLFLDAEQLTKVGVAMRALEKEELLEPQEAVAIRLLLLTGCRLNEILTLRWDYVHKATSTLELPDSKTGAKTVHLNAPALAVLSQLPRIEGNPFVIFSPRTKGQHLVNLQKPWRRVRDRAGLETIRLHDLRHAYGSMGAGIGLGLPVIGALLGHTQAATTQRYAHVQPNPLKQAANVIGARLLEAFDKDEKENPSVAPVRKIR